MRGVAWAAVAATLVACGEPSFTPCSVLCGAGGFCPAGSSCGEDGFCRVPGQTRACLDGGGLDAGEANDARAKCVLDVAAGCRFTCAVLGDQRVWCWGQNDQGQLGNPPTMAIPVPVMVPLEGARDVEAGGRHACAQTTGDLFCWGANDSQQQGDPEPGDHLPRRVSDAVEELALASRHSCGRNGGEVSCWGCDIYAVSPAMGCVSSTVPVSQTANVIDLEGSHRQTAAVTSDGLVYQWRGVGLDQAPVLVPGISEAVSVCVGHYHACAVDRGGALWCYGVNDYGQLGAGHNQPVTEPVTALSEDVVECSAGFQHTCARLVSGDVYCWGWNNRGQCGDGSLDDRHAPARVGVSGAVKIVAGASHSCALLTDGSLTCWGWNVMGQLGRGHMDDAPTPERPLLACP